MKTLYNLKVHVIPETSSPTIVFQMWQLKTLNKSNTQSSTSTSRKHSLKAEQTETKLQYCPVALFFIKV
jgi:hypothetical protein